MGESHRWDLVTIANNSGQNQYPGDFIEDSTLPENNDYPKNGNHKEAIPNNAPSYDLPEFEIKENESHNSSNSNYSETDDKENYDSDDNREINNPPLPPLDSSDLSNSTKETEDLKSQTNQTDDFIFYPPLAKHGQDINDANILENKPQKNKICRSKVNQRLIHRDIKTQRYLPISKINKAPSLVTKVSNQSLKNTDYVNVPVTKKLPATSEKKINILNWIGIVIISGLSSVGIIKNRY